MSLQCPFCEIAPDASIHNGALVFAIWDRYPVSPGHALIITRRHCATWFDATLEEQTELLKIVNAVRQIILARSGRRCGSGLRGLEENRQATASPSISWGEEHSCALLDDQIEHGTVRQGTGAYRHSDGVVARWGAG
jgi:hypothetical protein